MPFVRSQFAPFQRFSALTLWLITPPGLPTGVDERRRVRAFMSLALLGCGITFALSLAAILSQESTVVHHLRFLAALIVYVISRLGFYRLGMHAVILITAFFGILIHFVAPDLLSPIIIIISATISILLANLLLTTHRAVPVVILNLVLSLGVALLVNDGTLLASIGAIRALFPIALFVVVSSYLAAGDVMQWRAQQAEHNDGEFADVLKQLVIERTAELKRERQQLRAILDATGEGIYYSEGRRIRYINQALADMTGYTAAEVIGKHSSILQPADISSEELAKLDTISDAVIRGQTWRDEVRLGRKDGTSFEAGITVSRVGSADEETLRAVAVVRDVHHMKLLEAQKNRFIANASHELRTPIANLNTRMYLMREQPERLEQHLDKLERIVGRMNWLVGDLLDMAYFEQGAMRLQPEAIILQTVIRNVIAIQKAEAEKKGITLLSELEADPVQLWADPQRLEQVLTNLLTNAINYTAAGGRIRVRSELDAQSNTVTVAVCDSGCGIAPDDLPLIFQPFYRAEAGKTLPGTGLGLSISQEIVARHGGHIHVESEIGQGSTFYVTLPLLEA